MKKYTRELYQRKDLLLCLVTSALKEQHKNSFLGYLWWLLDPLLGVVIYYFIVVVVFHRGGEDYGMSLVIGMMVWRWLSSTLSSAAKSIVIQAGIITQVYLPKLIFPIGATLTHLFHFGFGLLIIAIFLVSFRIFPGMALLWLPYITLIQLLFLMALASVIAYICVFARDLDELLRLADGQQAEHHGIDQAEDGSVGANPEGEGEDGHGGEAGALPESAQSIAEVGKHRRLTD
ncbi:MAG: hypothetical protein HY268_28430 [Deltaproteobacteria bacterium]|nr:hypothetical protein [Deltaproteobacteria bacterium]